MRVCSYQRTADASELFILLEGLYLFLHSKIEENTILLGCISDQLNVKWETCFVVTFEIFASSMPLCGNERSFLQSATKYVTPSYPAC